MRRSAPRHVAPLDQGLQRLSVALGGDVDTQCVTQRGEEVDILTELANDDPRSRGSWVAPEPQHVVALREEPQLLDQPVIAELLTVVRGHDDQGVAPLPSGLDGANRSTQLEVDLAHHAVVLGTELS